MAAAKKVSENSYSPYSHFRVGAALLFSSGEIITGTNVENRSFGLTICAERSAVCSAFAQGYRDIQAAAIFCPDAREPVSPCGACRQVLSEFMDPESPVIFEDGCGHRIETKIQDLFPYDALHSLKNNL